MRRRISVVSALTVLAACNTGPISFNSMAPKPMPDSYACALGKVNEMGYTVTNTNKEAGFITADKQTSGLGTQLLTGAKYHTRLTVSIFGADSASRKMRVTAAKIEERTNLLTSSSTGVAPDARAKGDAQNVLVACGSGVISQEKDSFSAGAF